MMAEKWHNCNPVRLCNMSIMAFIVWMFLGCAPAGAADWRFYTETESEDMKFYYDADSITHLSESLIKVRIREVYISESGKHEIVEIRKAHGLPTEGFENFHYAVEVWVINCTDKTHRPLSVEYYNDRNSVLDSEYSGSGSWSPIVMDSAGEELYEILCWNTRYW